jgi:pimeloyl-ACP methyl ester carboxylesterase
VSASNYRSPEGERAAMAAYDDQLSRWPVPLEQRYVETPAGKTFVISWGEAAAPPLVLLHGSVANSSTWGIDAEAYGARFHVHAIDLPGDAGKSTPVRLPYGGPAYNDWLSSVLDALGLGAVRLAGLSLGGWVALKFAAAQPGRVERLAALAPGGVADARRSFIVKAAVYGPLGRWGAARMARVVFGPNDPPPGAAESFAFMLKHFRPRVESLPNISEEELSAITAPVLLLGGLKDAIVDIPGTRDRLVQHIRSLELDIRPGEGHALLGLGERVAEWLMTPGVDVGASGISPPAAGDRLLHS